jgi:SpoVK/Ycf46/Vps4 family AAA+-type ATPase
MSHFILKNKVKLHELEAGATIPESDFATLSGEYFLQFQFKEENVKQEELKVKPGIWIIGISDQRLVLKPTTFVQDKILDSFVSTAHIKDKIDKFFSRVQVYYDHGIEVPKRGMLLWGPAGSGKTTVINKVCTSYAGDNKTAVVVWPTDRFRSGDVKEFLKSFNYEGVERLILVAEDVGGVEVDQTRIPSDPSLLSILDNQEKTFKIPTLILATTNYPESFLGNLTNRPQRFDDKFKVSYPPAEARGALLKFFSKAEVLDTDVELITSTKCKDFTPAHVKEAIIRSAIYDIPLNDAIMQLVNEIDEYNKSFTSKGKVGF